MIHLVQLIKKILPLQSLRTNNSLNKDKILHQRYLYFKLLILYKWINFIQMLFSGRHLNLLNHQRTAVAEFFTISCHSPLYPTSLTILAVPMWSVHSLNPASAGWQTLLRTVIPRGLAKVAPEDDTWKVQASHPFFWSTNAQRMEESCSLLLSSVFLFSMGTDQFFLS